MDEKQAKLQVEVEKQRALKADLEACSNEDAAKKLQLIEAHKAQKKRVKSLKRSLRENYVKRGMVKKIVAAWIITVPAAAFLSAIIFFVIKGFAV
jgi:PiT family inorganic phosphate transporter